jgi:hypothetical protein
MNASRDAVDLFDEDNAEPLLEPLVPGVLIAIVADGSPVDPEAIATAPSHVHSCCNAKAKKNGLIALRMMFCS